MTNPKTLVTLVRADMTGVDEPATDLYLYVNNPLDDMRDALIAVAEAFVATDAGKEAVASNNGVFNWGDLVVEVPDDLFIAHGFTPVFAPVTVSFDATATLTVDRDELLLDPAE